MSRIPMTQKRVVNPNNLPEEELPHIWVFANGWMAGPVAQAVSDDGYGLGSHACSHEGYFAQDMGVLEGFRADRHETYAKHYSKGYILEIVPSDQIDTHEGLKKALAKAKEIYEGKSLEVDAERKESGTEQS